MSFRKNQVFGISAALTTPFAPDGTIDHGLLCHHARRVLDQGCVSVTLGGTTGEGPSLSHGEKIAAYRALTASGIAAGDIVFAIIESSLTAAIDAAREAARLGSRYVLVAPPFYFKGVAADGVADWYRLFLTAIADTGLHVILYHIPQLTTAPMPCDLVADLLAAFPKQISGIKDSAGDWSHTRQLLERFPDIDILIGDERLLEQGVALGASGAISGVANFRVDLLTPILTGATADAHLAGLVENILRYPVTPAVKALVAHLNGEAGWRGARAPLAGLTKDQYDTLCAGYDGLYA
ncbi:MAG: dihydrodipicolinate synthase family protein [Pseudomonadota bacterium]